MTNKNLIITCFTLVISAALLGCNQEAGKSSTPASDESPAGETQPAESLVDKATETVNATVESAKEAGTRVVEEVKTAGSEAVTTITEKASALSEQGTSTVQGYIDAAKNYVAEGKYKDALAQLEQTTGFSLSGEQQQLVDSLKAQIEKAMSSFSTAATNATGFSPSSGPVNR